jgi:hypothetical protein
MPWEAERREGPGSIDRVNQEWSGETLFTKLVGPHWALNPVSWGFD